MDLAQALERIRGLADPRAVAIWQRMGGDPARYLGANLTRLKALAKEIKKDHALALALWETGVHDAMLLATMIEEPRRVTGEQIAAQAEQIDYWDLADKFCTNVVGRTPLAQAFAERWVDSEREILRRCAYTLVRIQAKEDESKPDSYFEPVLERIGSEIQSEANWAKEGMLNALIGIGSRNQQLNRRAIGIAERVGPVHVDYGDTSCKTPDPIANLRKAAERWR